MKSTLQFVRYSIFLIALFSFASCGLATDKRLSEKELSYSAPITKPLKMPSAKQINWRTHPADSFPVGFSMKINLNSLPSVPFRVNGFKPLKSAITEVKFDLKKLKTYPINMDTIKATPITLKKFLLPKPTITVANMPIISDKGTSGILKLAQSEGLLGNNVYAIATDKQGNVWLTTERGLIKYCGNEFYAYNFFSRDGISGTQEISPELLFDKQGRLLVSTTASGIYRINLKTNVVENFSYKKLGLYRMTIDQSGKLWGNGFNLIDLDKKQFFALSPQLAGADLHGALGTKVDREGNIWVGMEDKIAILDASRKAVRVIGLNEGINVFFPYDFTEDKSGNIWVANSQEKVAYFISLKNQKISSLGAKQGYFGGLAGAYIDKRDRVWMVSNDTISVYDPKKSLIKKMFTGAKSFIGRVPASGAQDAEGKIWLGTAGDGALIIDPEGMLSEHLSTKDGLESDDIWGVREDSQSRVLMSTYKGVQIYNPKTERLSLLKFPSQISTNANRGLEKIGNDVFYLGSAGGFAILDFPANTMTFYDTRKTGICELTFTTMKSPDGTLWSVGDKGVIVLDIANKTVKSLDRKHGLISDLAYIIEDDKQGRVWVITDLGLSLINPKTNTIQNLSEEHGLASNYTAMFYQTTNGDIYIGTDKGISVIDKNLKTVTNVSVDNGLLPLSVYDMLEINGRVQMATDNGLVVSEKPKKPGLPWRFYNFSKSSGFPYSDYNQSTAAALSNGQVWWAAAPILTVVHQDPLIDSLKPRVQIKGINIMDQNPSFVKVSTLGNYLNKGDTISIAGKNYSQDKLPEETGYLIENGITWDEVTTGFNVPIGLKLPYNQNSFNVSFSNQSVIARDKISYRYILQGEDKEWSEAGPKSFSKIYYNLAPGTYSFKVITRGFNGRWSEPDILNFRILPPWWQTWWAWLGYTVLFLSIIYWIVRTRSAILERENKVLEEKVQHRTRQLEKTISELTTTQSQLIQSEKMASLGELTAGIAHEIQNPLNFVNNFSELSIELIEELKLEINSGGEAQDELLADISQNLSKINHHGKRADAIVKGMLQHSRASGGQKEETDINRLSDEYLRLSYHGLRAKDKSFNATFKSEFDETIGKVKIVPQDIGRVIMNLLTNAFYAVNEKKSLNPEGYEPTVVISTKKLSGGIEIKISDNGTGIPQAIAEKIFQPFFTTKPTGKGTGLGLSMSYDIVTKGHGGTLTVNSNVQGEGGTEFTIYLPL